jgi:hypothetical protein
MPGCYITGGTCTGQVTRYVHARKRLNVVERLYERLAAAATQEAGVTPSKSESRVTTACLRVNRFITKDVVLASESVR